MSDVSAAIAEKNGLTKDNINWIVPHQANVRIIEAVAHRMEAVSYTHLPHIGTETRSKLLREAAVRNIGQWTRV